jgi:type I restriction enzyme S subunit
MPLLSLLLDEQHRRADLFCSEGWGTAQVNISVPILKALPTPMPPQSEQVAIAAFLDSATAALDTLIDQAERVIALLRERRTALISSVVTGQIDVRTARSSESAA